jgi:hypothetical protein
MPPSTSDPQRRQPNGPAVTDPVRARRQQIARWTQLANRLGYLGFAVAIVCFAVALATGFTSTMASIVIGSLIVGSILLAPSIVLGYAIKAAEREDRERGI